MNTEGNTSPSQELINAVADAYENPEEPEKSHATLEQLSAEFNLPTMTVRKMLITAGVYSTRKSREVLEFYNSGYTVEQIMQEMGMKYNTVLSYIPYSRTVYNLSFATDDAKNYRERRAKLEKEKKKAEKRLEKAEETVALSEEDLRNYPDGIDKLRSAMPFLITEAQLGAVDAIKQVLENSGMLMIYGTGNGKSAILKRLILGELSGFTEEENAAADSTIESIHVVRFKDGKYQICPTQMYSLLTENDLIVKIAGQVDIHFNGRTKTAEKRKILLQGIRAKTEEGNRIVFVFNDLDAIDRKHLGFLYLLRDLNAAGASVIFCSQTYTYEEVISEYSRKKYKDDDIEELRNDLRERCRTYKLGTMTRDEVFRYLDCIEQIYRLQFTMGAREELAELAQEPIRNGNTYFGIQIGSILTMTSIVEHTILLSAGLRKMESEGKLENEVTSEEESQSIGIDYDAWNRQRMSDLIRKCNCIDVDGSRLITRNLIYYLYRERTGGMNPNDLP